MIRSLLLLLTLSGSAGAAAQVRPQPGPGDPRIQTVQYDAGQVIELQGAPGYQMTVELSPDEQVQTVAVGDSGAWQVTANRRGDLLFIKPLQGDVATNMTVITSVRTYNFALSPLYYPTPEMAWTVRLRYPAPAPETPAQVADPEFVSPKAVGTYRLSGDRLLRPSAIGNDGYRTFVRWPPSRPLPAVYEIGDRGEELLVNSRIEDDAIIIDGIARRLSFRIDERVARAERIMPRKHRR